MKSNHKKLVNPDNKDYSEKLGKSRHENILDATSSESK